MNIEYIKIKNYKSFDYCNDNKISFNEGLNLFIGQNNSGKTTVIEALRLLNPSLIFEEIQHAWNAKFSYVDPRIFVNQENLCKFSKNRPTYFEFEIKINDISPLYNSEYSKITSGNHNSFIKYSIRVYPFEQAFQFCLLNSLETDLISVNIDLPSFENYHRPLLDDELSKIFAIKKVKKDGIEISIEYAKYLNLKNNGKDSPEIGLLKSLKYFYEHSFYSPFQHVVQNHKKEFYDILPEFKLLHELKSLQDKVYHYESKNNTKHEDYYISRKLLDEFIKYSKQIIGNLEFNYVAESHDFQEERTSRQAWPEDNSLSNLSEDARFNKFKKYYAFFKIKTSRIIEYSSLGDGVKGALNILFEILKFKHLIDEKKYNYNSLCLIIDEFDMNMHQYLSSTIFKLIVEISEIESMNNQIILTTHSNSFIDQCEEIDIHINSIKLNEKYLSTVRLITDKEGLVNAFNEIGYKPSQFFIANGIIWVEGPSDIIYINFLLQLYISNLESDEFIRGKHFDFILYGGSNIKHHVLSDSFSNNLINLLHINPNCFVVFDKDNYGTSNATSSEQNKKKIIDAINNVDKYWMTQGTYIEHYLAKNDLEMFESKIKNKRSKVEFANKMISSHKNYDYWFNEFSDLEEQITKLVNNIYSWNN